MRLTPLEARIRNYVQHYNHNRYWRLREKVISGGGIRLLSILRLFYIKRSDAFNNATTGAHIGFGAKFTSPPNLPHGLYGIIISHNAVIGEDCTIFHQVTIGEGRGGAPTIGNHVLLGAGCKVIGGIHIGDNVKIGAGCVVMQDIPDYATVLPATPIIKIKYREVEVTNET
jgi:serine acetyltransferase